MSNCTEQVDFTYPTDNPQLVVVSAITPNSNIKVRLFRTQNIEDNTDSRVPNAKIDLYENEVLLGTLTEISPADYTFNYHPRINANYKLITTAEEFANIVSEEKIPDTSYISDATYIYPFRYDEAEMSNFAACYFTIHEPVNEENFYEITSYYINRYGIEPSICEVYNLNSNDPVIISEGITDYKPTTLFFSDKLFNGQDYQFSFEFCRLNAPNYNGQFITDSIDVMVVFRSISKNYYNYRKSWTKHLYNQGLHELDNVNEITKYMFSGEPVRMFTNVKNGLGVFVGYSETQKEMIRIQSIKK